MQGINDDDYVAGIKEYLYQKTLEIIHNGLDVIAGSGDPHRQKKTGDISSVWL